jgi:hypothetical protein
MVTIWSVRIRSLRRPREVLREYSASDAKAVRVARPEPDVPRNIIITRERVTRVEQSEPRKPIRHIQIQPGPSGMRK